MSILGFLLLIIGAVIGFMGKQTYKFIMKISPNEMDILKTKVIGLAIALAGAALILIYLR